MPQAFTRSIEREVTLRSGSKALPAATWILSISESGVTMRRKGTPAERAMPLTWRSIIGHALIHVGER